MDDEELGKLVLDCAFKVHSDLGPGLLESAYETCLSYELRQCDVQVERQVVLPIHYNDVVLDAGYRIDLFVGDRIVVELKAVEKLTELHQAQLLSYLKLGDYWLGYLLNFNVKSMKEGIKRIVNGFR